MVSISGVRGIVGSTLTPEIVVQYASAFAEYCHRGRIVIGRDGRITGKSIGHILSSTLLSMGCDVIALGVCPTPTVQLAVSSMKAAGGVSVTASHNPMEWNGMKFISPSGMFLDREESERFWTIAQRPERTYATWDRQGKHAADDTFIARHIEAILSLPLLNVEIVRKRRLKVVVDCVNASAGALVPKLLREFGCTVIEMNCDLSGIFSHKPEPLPENLSELCARVKAEGADLGIAVDPDGDRLVLIDEHGAPFGEEYTIASAVRFVLEKEARLSREAGSRTAGQTAGSRTQQAVVVNLSTTRAVDDIAKQYGAQVYRTPVGEIHVAKKMKEVGSLIGGEGSGGVILPALHFARDASVGIGLILEFLAEFGGSLSQLKNSMPQYVIKKTQITVDFGNIDSLLQRFADRYGRNGNVTTLDGVKIDFEDSWVHLRKSNTEPIIRIIAEARTNEAAEEFTRAVLKDLKA
jgi:phosphomannomutase